MKTLSVLSIQMKWKENLPSFVFFAVAALIGYAVISRFRDHFVPEFLEQGNVRKTKEMVNSSFKQDTNHVRPDGHFAAPPIQGVESPFRVNMFDSYIT
jgi:hypothetical protein